MSVVMEGAWDWLDKVVAKRRLQKEQMREQDRLEREEKVCLMNSVVEATLAKLMAMVETELTAKTIVKEQVEVAIEIVEKESRLRRRPRSSC